VQERGKEGSPSFRIEDLSRGPKMENMSQEENLEDFFVPLLPLLSSPSLMQPRASLNTFID
jgi:hypothetical protein